MLLAGAMATATSTVILDELLMVSAADYMYNVDGIDSQLSTAETVQQSAMTSVELQSQFLDSR